MKKIVTMLSLAALISSCSKEESAKNEVPLQDVISAESL